MHIGEKIIHKIYRIFRVKPTLAHQMQFWAILAVLLPCLIFLGIETIYEVKSVELETHEYLQQVVSLQQGAIDQWFRSQLNDIRGIARLYSVRSLDRLRMEQDFKAFVHTHSHFYDINFINNQGQSEVAAIGLDKLDVSDRNYFQAALRGQNYVSDISYDPLTGAPRIIISSPVYDYQDEFQGVIAGSVKLDTISRIMEKFQFGATGETYLATREGVMITESRFTPELVRQGVIPGTTKLKLQLPSEFVQYWAYHDTGSGRHLDYRGKEVYFAHQVMADRNWIVIGEIDADEVMDKVYAQVGLLFSGFVCVVLLIIPMTIAVSRTLSRPIKELTQGTRSLEAGNYEYKPPAETAPMTQELSILYNTFNQMASTIHFHVQMLNYANAATAEAELKYRSLVENSHVGVYILDRDTIVYLNPRAYEMFGYTEADGIIGQSIFTFIHEEDHGRLQERIYKLLSFSDNSIVNQFRGVKKNGDVVYCEVLASTCRLGNKDVLMGTMIDITTRKEAEINLLKIHEELEQRVEARTKELVEANARASRAEHLASLGTMAAGIIHEINQPLNSIKVTTDSLLFWHQRNQAADPEDILKDVSFISRQVGRIEKIIQQIRSFVHLEKSQYCEQINLTRVVEDILPMLEGEISNNGIRLITELRADIPYVEVSQTQIEEIVINLLTNAIHSFDNLPDENRKEIRIVTGCENDAVFLKVEDTGTGIAPEIQERIYDPFFTTKAVGQGMGLGLSIVHSIVIANQGQIRAMNNAAGGAVFIVEFPISRQGA